MTCGVWAVTAAVAVAVGGCSAGPTTPVPKAAATADTAVTTDAKAEPPCPPGARSQDGTCCLTGQFYSTATKSCAAAGPAECAAVAWNHPEQCHPRWCATWQDAAGKPCDAASPACAPAVHPCGIDELAAGKGCFAGSYPTAAGVCVAAGVGMAQAVTQAGLSDPLPPQLPAGTMAADALPSPLATAFCAATGKTDAMLCGATAAACPAGEMPDATTPSKCVPFAPQQLCPAGFAVDPAQPEAMDDGLLAGCKAADPCGPEKYAPQAEFAAALHVDAAAPAGGDGSLGAPFASIAAAVGAAPSGAVIAVAAGTYPQPLELTKAVTIIGRCAAGTTIDPGKTAAVAVHVTGPGVSISHLRLTGTAVGIRVEGAGALTADQLWLDKTISRGVRVDGATASCTLSNSYVSDTQAASNGDGLGAYVANSGTLTLQHVRARLSRGGGVVALTGGKLSATDVTVDGTTERTTDGSSGMGIFVGGGSTATLTTIRIHGNGLVGLAVVGKGTTATVRGLLSDFNLPTTKSPNGGMGVQVATGGHLTLDAARLHHNSGTGLAVESTGTTATVHGLIVDATQANDNAELGDGVEVTQNGQMTLDSLRVTDVFNYGVLATHQGSSITGSGWTIDSIKPQLADSASARGLRARDGASITVSGVHIRDIVGTGIRSSIAGSIISVQQALITAITANPESQIDGHGVDVLNGGRFRAVGMRVSGVVTSGVQVADIGTSALLVGVLVDGTVAGLTGSYGEGVFADRGAALQLYGSRVFRNRWLGVRLLSFGEFATTGQVVGCVVDRTGDLPGMAQIDVTKSMGYGVSSIGAQSQLTLSSSIVAQDRAVGVAALFGQLTVANTVVRNTMQAAYNLTDLVGQVIKTVQLADGIAARMAGKCEITDTTVVGNPRAGLMIEGGTANVLTRVLVTGNFFGLAQQGGAHLSQGGVVLTGNEQNAVSDQALQVPPPPELGEVVKP